MPEPLSEPDIRAPPTGERFGKFVLLRQLAVGGMAEVHLANLEGTDGFNKPVVLKQVLPHLANDPAFIEMFLDEARLAARLSHPNIAQTFELGREEGRYYLAMEYVPGETVYQVKRRAERTGTIIPLQCTLRVVLELLEALEYAHSLTDAEGRPLRVVHRDVSPSNVMITYHGGVKLLDFGIARAATRHHHTQVGIVKGKHGYMAPEQCRSGAAMDHRVDVFATGAVLYALATGRPAFDCKPSPQQARLREMEEARFPPPREVRPDLPEALERIILRAMARSPDDRYESANAMGHALEQFAASAGLFPSPRQLGELVRGLFPEKAPLAHAMERTPDAKTVARLIERVSEGDIVDEEVTLGHAPGVAASPASATVPLEQRLGMEPLAPTRRDRQLPVVAASRRSRRGLVLGAAGVLAAAAAGFAVVTWRQAPGPPPTAAPSSIDSAQAPASAERGGGEEPVARAEPVATTPPPVSDSRPVRAPERKPPARAAPPKKQATGRVLIDSYPWTHVTEAGRKLGTTPLNAELPEGWHEFVLENEALGVRRSVRLSVRAGEETSHFERIPPP